jgi:hypothetical protein
MELMRSDKEWMKARVDAVLKKYTAYQALIENGVTLLDEDTSLQILCPFHGDKNKPSARYYSGSGRDHSHFYCFKCRMNLNAISLHAKFNGLEWKSALERLERRFQIKVPRKDYSNQIDVKGDYNSNKSKSWNDVTKMLGVIEDKLLRSRNMLSMVDYIKSCRMLDAISYDFDKTGEESPNMVAGLNNLARFIDKSRVQNANLE